MSRLLGSIHLRPTGPDYSYRRSDYWRGALVSLGFAVAFCGLALLLGGYLPDRVWTEVGLFVTAILALVAVGSAVILGVQGVIGSSEPAGFAIAPDFVPAPFRALLRSILIEHWDPLARRTTPGPHPEYDRYLPLAYDLGRSGSSPEAIAEQLARMESLDSLVPGSDAARRLDTGQRIQALFR